MAANDYSRRSKKDVFWGDDNNKSKSNELDELIKDEITLEEDTENNASEPICEPVTEPLPEVNFDEDFDMEKFFRENDSKITTTVTVKILTHFLLPVLLLGITLITFMMHILCFSVIFYFIAFLIISNKFTNDYEEYINKAIESFKKIKLYKHKIEGGAAWGKMISCPGEAYTKDLTRIEIDDNIVKAMDLEIFLNMGRYGTITYFTGMYYEIALGDKSFADNVLLVKGNIKHIKKRVYTFQHNGYTIYAYNEDYIENSDMNRVYALADELRNYLNNKNFIINFSGDKILLMLAADIKDNFHYGFFNYAITDRLRRDISLLKNRIKIAEILASA